MVEIRTNNQIIIPIEFTLNCISILPVTTTITLGGSNTSTDGNFEVCHQLRAKLALQLQLQHFDS